MTGETDHSQSDSTLLKAWVKNRDREAIGRLISRHINFVYAVAYRQVRGDVHLAEDVTQAVFILLLQKAHRIQSEAAMASWLFTTTRYAAANAIKTLRRRKHYEHQAAQQAQTETTGDLATIEDENLEPVLNDAINSLPKPDRACVIMSYLQQKSHREVGAAMGMSEEAARKRVSRAIERMREFVLSRGVAAPAVVIGSSLMKSTAVSAQFIESTVNVATLSQSAVQSGSAITIAKGVSKMFFAMKVKVAAAVAGIVFGGIVTAQVVQNALSRTMAMALTGEIQNPQTKDSSMVSLGDGVTVNFAGVSRYPSANDSWYSIDGKPIVQPLSKSIAQSGRTFSKPAYLAAALVRCPGDVIVRMKPLDVERSTWHTDASAHVVAFQPKDGAQTVDLEIVVADGQWNTLAKLDKAASDKAQWGSIMSAATENGGVSLSPAVERDGNAVFYVSVENVFLGQWRVVANDVSGLPHIAMPRNQSGAGKTIMGECAFDIPALMIASLEIQMRPFNKRVIAKNITLDPAKPTTPQIIVEKEEK